MHRVHRHLCRKSPLYHKWHQHPLHPHVHWGVLGAVVLGVALSFVILGWSEMDVAFVQVARAQSPDLRVRLIGNGPYKAAAGNFDGDAEPDFLINDANGTYEEDGTRQANFLLYTITDDGRIGWQLDTGFDPGNWSDLSVEAGVWDFTGDGIDDVVAQRESGGDYNLVVLDGRNGHILGETRIPVRSRKQFLLSLAYLACPYTQSGCLPSVVVANGEGGYPQRVIAYDVSRQGAISQRWLSDDSSWFYQGESLASSYPHQIETWDIDGDGRDEIIYGGVIFEEDGSIYFGIQGHADRAKVHDILPSNPGLEMFLCYESAQGSDGRAPSENVGVYLIDVDQRRILWKDVGDSVNDTGWGHCHQAFIGEFNENEEGFEVWANGYLWEDGEFPAQRDNPPLRSRLYAASGDGRGSPKLLSVGTGTGEPVEWDGDDTIETFHYSGRFRDNGFGSDIGSLPNANGQMGLVDITGDGKEEIFYGSSDGNFYYFRNTGGASLPVRRTGHNYEMNKARTASGYWVGQPPDPGRQPPPDVCVCSGWQNNQCGAGSCSADQMRQTKSCTPADCDTESRCVASSNCQPLPPAPATQVINLPSLGIPETETQYKVGVGDLTGDGNTDFVVIAFDDVARRVPNRLFAFRHDGLLLWQRDTGLYSRDTRGHIYTAVSLNVWDLNGDGKAEVITQLDDDGVQLVILDGLTGTEERRVRLGALGNFIYSTIAYLNGRDPSIVVAQNVNGVTVRAYNRDFNLLWQFSDPQHNGSIGERISTFDIDNDGNDEIINGPLILNEDGTIYYGELAGFAPRAFVHDIDPNNPGYEFYVLLSDFIGRPEPASWKGVYLIDVDQRRILWHYGGDETNDTGWGYGHRGWVAELDESVPGLEIWATGYYWEEDEYARYQRGEIDRYSIVDKSFVFSAKGQILDRSTVNQHNGFPVQWDDDPEHELYWFRSGKITNGFRGSTIRSNIEGGSGEAFIEADVRGDWREEVIVARNANLYVYSNDQRAIYPTRLSPRTGHNYRLNLSRTGSGFWKPQPFDNGTGDGGSLCGQNGCEAGETAQSCPQDCGSTQNQPPRNLVLRYLGPTPTGGNLCGNPPGRTDPGEQCDGKNLNGQTCQSRGFTGGTLSCTSSCTFNTSQCTSAPQCTPACGSWSDSANQCGTRNCTKTDCSTYTDTRTCGTTGDKRSYPLSAIWQWGGAPAWWYGQFDLVFTRPTGKSFVDAVKAVNPDVIFIPTHDFNTACDDNFISCTEEDYLHYVNGNRMSVGTATDDNATNLSKFSPLTTKIPDRVDEIVRTTGADGYGTDGLYDGAYYGYYGFPAGTDMNNDGVEDRSVSNWTEGVIQILQGIRNKIGSNSIFIYNPDNETGLASYVNGYTHEYSSWPETGTWESREKNYWLNIASKVVSPPTFLQASSPNNGDPGRPNPDINWLRFVRAKVAEAVLLDRYFEFENTYSGKPADHLWNNYHDELDLDLGQPTSAVQQVKSGVWVRFLERGAAIFVVPDNPATWPQTTTVTVSDSDLRSASGYAGPYYRFLGGQDQALGEGMNNGQQFTSVNFTAYQYSGYQNTMYTSGDGILLVKSPQTVVADLIIDNDDSGTSPASSQATLSGFEQHSGCSDASDYYAVRCFTEPPYAESSGGGTATFRPNIGVAGNYEVFEWHGRLSSGSLASNVTYTINQAGGSTNRTVNQQANAGQWNSLGTYRFNAGTNGNVTISASGTKGTVMADAVMFRYVGP